MNKRNINRLDKNIVMMKNLNKRLMKAEFKHYKLQRKRTRARSWCENKNVSMYGKCLLL